mgnify:CR=1 FL=1
MPSRSLTDGMTIQPTHAADDAAPRGAASTTGRVAVPAGEVRDALLTGTGPHAPVLRLADAYERGEWAEVDADDNVAIALRAELAGLYADAALWATERLRITG